MMIYLNFASMSDGAILAEIGRRVRARRLAARLTQAEVAEAAGLDRTTVGALERDGSATLLTLVQVLRALGALDELETFLPEPGPSPLELARRGGRLPQRVRHRKDETPGDRNDD